jgi:hypothetical protein
VARLPPQQQHGDQQQQIELYDKMRAMGGDAILRELYESFLDLFMRV